MRKITHQERDTINTYIKNGIDISALIEGKDIQNQNFNRAIISKMERVKDDISGCSFAFAKLGSKEIPLSIKILQTKMQNCNFECAEFIGTAWIRNCDAQNCNFKGADVSNVDYRFTNFLGSSFCESKIRISSKSGFGCKFPKEMWQELTKQWDMKINVISQSEELKNKENV